MKRQKPPKIEFASNSSADVEHYTQETKFGTQGGVHFCALLCTLRLENRTEAMKYIVINGENGFKYTYETSFAV